MSNFGIDSYINSINQAQPAGLGQSGRGALSSKAQNAIALGKSNAGDIVTGEVVNVNGKSVQIQLDNKNVITARLENNMNVSVGQSLAFEVKSNMNGQIALTPLFTNTTMNPAMIKAITMASLPLSEQTIGMTATMMDNGMGIDRQSMQQMYSLINEYADADPSNLVSMKAMGIPINENSIEQFEIYKNNEHQILNAANDLSDELGNVIGELSLSETGELVNIFAGNVDEKLLLEMKNNLAAEEIVEEPEVVLEEQTFAGPFGASFADANRVKEEPQEMVITEEVNRERSFEAVDAQESDLTKLMGPEERSEFAKTLFESGLSDEKIDSILDGSASPQQVMAYTQAAIELSKSDNHNHEALSKLVSSKSFTNLLKDAMSKEWTIRADEGFSKESVKELYNKISQGSEKLLNFLQGVGKGDSAAANMTQNIQQNLNFMNDLNQLFQYVQVPLKFSEENANGDLFVYTNKKKLSEKDGEVSALLHLDMQALGTMDIHVSMKDKDHVNTHFYMANDALLDFVSEHLGELDERLKERGYTMHSVASVRDTKAMNENEINNKAVATMLGIDKHKIVAKYSFDMRA